MDLDLRHSFVQTNGVRLHVVESGPPNGPLVLMLHGFPEFWYGWRKQIGPLAQAGFHVVAPDQRGYNTSEKPPGVSAYHLDETTKDALGLIDAFGASRAAVVGHDWGGAVAWALAIQHCERISRLVILNMPHPGVMLQALRRRPQQLMRSMYAAFFQLPRLPEALLGMRRFSGLERMIRLTAPKSGFTEQDIQLYRQAWSQDGALTSMLNWYRAAGRKPPSQLAGREVRVPTLMLWGGRDPAFARGLARESIDQCREGWLEYYADASHFIQHEAAERINPEIVDFLSSWQVEGNCS